MAAIEQFTIGATTYNVVRASAIQQDEILSMLNAPLAERLAALGIGEVPEEDFVLNFVTALPFHAKQQFDSLLLSRVTKHGSESMLSIRDFDGQLFELNQLRAKVLMWNLAPFFTYWASVIKKSLDEAKKAESQTA